MDSGRIGIWPEKVSSACSRVSKSNKDQNIA